jgi:hypothetical protein
LGGYVDVGYSLGIGDKALAEVVADGFFERGDDLGIFDVADY